MVPPFPRIRGNDARIAFDLMEDSSQTIALVMSLIENSNCFVRLHIVLQGDHIVLQGCRIVSHEGHIVLQGDDIVLQTSGMLSRTRTSMFLHGSV